MTNAIDLSKTAREIFEVALASVDAEAAVRNSVRFDGSRLAIVDTTIDLDNSQQAIYAMAIGKAAFPMAAALDDILGDQIKAGLIVGTPLKRYEDRFDPRRGNFVGPWELGGDAHPIPNKSSLTAARSAFELMRRAEMERALLIFMISGGGSSMIEWPVNDQITLDNLRDANRSLISCGASISEINSVRRAFSAVKGGRLAARAPSTDQITLVISDTAKGQESIVASGPTYEPPLDDPVAVEVVARYGLAEQLPPAVLRAVNSSSETKSKIDQKRLRRHHVLLDCETALKTARDEARRKGLVAEYTTGISEQLIAEGCELILSQLVELRARESTGDRTACLISGGEFSCPVRGEGVGGRNAETVLRCAIEIDEGQRRQLSNGQALQFAILSAGTDGIDGNSPAAGAVATNDSAKRARILGLEPGDYLERSDAFSFFDALNDTIVTGPTGTNVRDLRITLAG